MEIDFESQSIQREWKLILNPYEYREDEGRLDTRVDKTQIPVENLNLVN